MLLFVNVSERTSSAHFHRLFSVTFQIKEGVLFFSVFIIIRVSPLPSSFLELFLDVNCQILGLFLYFFLLLFLEPLYYSYLLLHRFAILFNQLNLILLSNFVQLFVELFKGQSSVLVTLYQVYFCRSFSDLHIQVVALLEYFLFEIDKRILVYFS